MFKFVLLALGCLYFQGILCSGSGIYTVIAPENFRANSIYNVSISVFNQTDPVSARVAIRSRDVKYRNVENVEIAPNSTKIIQMRIGDVNTYARYKLFVEGVDGLVFAHNRSLGIETKNVSIFVQTDKGMYKPDEEIRFRVLVLDFELKPVELNRNESTFLIYVNDAENNRIKQWKNVKLSKGVFGSQLKLPKQPVLGEWKIVVEIDEETKVKTVEIAEYELPKFQVKIEGAKHFTVKDGIIRVLIRSTYTFGKGVKGNGSVVLSTSSGDYSSAEAISMFNINGKVYVDFAIDSDIQYNFDNGQKDELDCVLNAKIIDKLSGKNAVASKKIVLHRNRYKITSDVKTFTYRVGVPIRLSVSLKYFDDTPFMITESNRDILIGQKYTDDSKLKYTRYELDANGMVSVTMYGESYSFDVIVKYKDEQKKIGKFIELKKEGVTSFSVKMLTKEPKLNQNILFEVEALKPIDYLIYQLIAGGKLIDSKTITVPSRKYHVFSIPATFDLLPKAKLIVYYFDQRQIVSSKLNIEIKQENVRLKNFVDINLSTDQAQPSELVNISVYSNPKSYIGLMGIDQSVHLLKTNDDLTIERALAEMKSYQDKITHGQAPYGYQPNKHEDEYKNFESLNVMLFTNALKPPKPIPVHRPITPAWGWGPSHSGWHRPLTASAYSSHSSFSSAQSTYYPSTTQSFLTTQRSPQPTEVMAVIRSDFTETWLWESIDDEEFNGTKVLERRVPDTITSWMISAFSVDGERGLGLMDEPKSLNVFQPFFVSINLPFSAIRGEIVHVPIIVQSYLNEKVVAEVTIHNQDEDFEFVDEENNSTTVHAQKHQITIYPGDGVATNVSIKFKKIGSIAVEVTAVSALAGDGITKVVAVRPEGVVQYVNRPAIIDLRHSRDSQQKIHIDLPSEDIVPDSLHLEVNCYGDIFGSTMENLNKLIRLPSGCGEQNMLNFAPNILIWDYLNTTQQLRPDVRRKIKSYTEIGYQGELSYRHYDGSFSVFGKSDPSGSTWLTAFVAKSFRHATAFVDIDESIIKSALDWLINIQSASGNFPEIGQVSHRPLQGGASNGVALTSYVLITLLENKEHHPKLSLAIDNAVYNIVKNIRDIDDTYVLAIAAYALQLANHQIEHEVLTRLIERSTTVGRVKYWRKETPFGFSKTLDVETTAYGILALLRANRFEDALPYAYWLLDQRNSKGAFEGTQDTVIGLQALAEFAKSIPSSKNDLNISITAGHEKQKLVVNANNAMLLQKIEVNNSVESIGINAMGHGFALIDVSWRYNLVSSVDNPAFIIHPRMHHVRTFDSDDTIGLEICVAYNQNRSSINDVSSATNMVVMEVTLPTGFTADSSLFTRLQAANPLIKKVELKNGDTVVVIYFDYLEANRIVCPIIDGFRVQKVLKQKSVSIVVYDYYESAIRARTFYEKTSHTKCQGVFCDIPMPLFTETATVSPATEKSVIDDYFDDYND